MDKFAMGTRIDGGLSRVAYDSKHWPERVVKSGSNGDNRKEFNIWKNANRNLRKYLARVYAISADGSYLLMQRTRPVSRERLIEHMLPDVINHDAHKGNLGELPDGRIVMHDYAGVYQDPLPRTTGRHFSKPGHVS
jgi:hypothetical protein